MTAEAARLVMPQPAGGAGEAGYRAVTLPATFGEFPAMVEFVFATGNRLGLPYAWLSEVAFDPAAGVTLAFSTGAAVAVTGRHLEAVYAALLAHRAVAVREADPPTAALAAEGVAVVEGIRVDRAPA